MNKENLIALREDCVLSEWVTLVSKTMSSELHSGNATYHSLKQGDYISILAVTCDGLIPLVRQYRPAVEKVTLELPGGLLEKGELPYAAAERELMEETGFKTGELQLIGHLIPDSGRLENRLWCYFAKDVTTNENVHHINEPGVEAIVYSPLQLFNAVQDGSFEHALHIAILGLAVIKGLISLP